MSGGRFCRERVAQGKDKEVTKYTFLLNHNRWDHIAKQQKHNLRIISSASEENPHGKANFLLGSLLDNTTMQAAAPELDPCPEAGKAGRAPL